MFESLYIVTAPLMTDKIAEHGTVHMPDNFEQALECAAYYMLNSLNNYILNYELLSKGKSWSELNKQSLWDDAFWFVSKRLADKTAGTIQGVRPNPTRVEVLKLEGNIIVAVNVNRSWCLACLVLQMEVLGC